MNRLTKRLILGTALLVPSLTAAVSVGCVHRSGGEWMFASAPLPEGWPTITPVGEVAVKDYPVYRVASYESKVVQPEQPSDRPATQYVEESETPEGWPEVTPVDEIEVKEYPEYRAAIVDQTNDSATIRREGMNSMFMSLFRHIKKNDIAMTAPVEMEYVGDADNGLEMSSMAFLYRTTEFGKTGPDGSVIVEDIPARTWVTIGVRGGYTTANFVKARAKLIEWLQENPGWSSDGDARYLGYNGPFVPRPARYGEVQIPVIKTGSDSPTHSDIDSSSEDQSV